MMLQRGKALARKTNKHEVVQRSVTMSSTAPNLVDCWYLRAATPSSASSKQEMLYRKEHVRGCRGI